MKKILTRSLSGIVYVAIILSSILLGQPYFASFVALLSILGALEFTKITQGLAKERAYMISIDVLITVFVALAGICVYSIYVALVLYMIRFIATLYSKQENPLRSLSYSMLTISYIGLPLFLMSKIYELEGGLLFTLAMFVLIWINDTGAFVVGCSIGKHRLFERISPKKSWEGFLGGLVFNVVTAVSFCYFRGSEIDVTSSLSFCIGFAVVVTIFATWGDLVESLIKRTLHLKDSGNIIPGHGGILDRIDSLLLVAPAIFLYLFLFIKLV